MFENEEWDINEDDLKDIVSDDIFNDNNDKSENSVSKKSFEAIKGSVVLLNSSAARSNIFGNHQNNETFQHNESISKKKIVLDIFRNNSNSQAVSNVRNEHGKNLILNVFQDVAEKAKPVVKSVLKIPDNENKFKRKKNVAFIDSPSESNIAKKVCTERINKLQEPRNSDKYINQENQLSRLENSASYAADASNYNKQMLIDLQKTSVQKSIKVPRLKQAVIRKFPGPAGILPDDVSENDIIDLDSLEENKNNKSNQYADICSQNTKNLFTTGAWQLMMDDLPADFELYDIATIKENALQYSKSYKKVPYLAGIVQYIDYKPNDPHIILKDLSGKVDARVHHSICKLYPNALGTSIVILARDVGLIVTSKKFVCVIISLNNLVSIYSDDARLVETPHLKTLFENSNSNKNLHESQISVLDEIECNDKSNRQISKNHSPEPEIRHQQQSPSIPHNKFQDQKLKEINGKDVSGLKAPRKDSVMQEFDFDEDNSWLGVDIDELNSFKSHQFPSSTPMDTHENDSDDIHFEIKKSNNILPQVLKDVSESEKIVTDSKLSCSTDKKKISEKLLLFRNTNETSGQSIISKHIGLTGTIAPTTTKSFQPECNDTDDEILSQLDVDAIAASYRTENC